MTEQSQGHQELPRTAYLDHTLRRARTAAEQRSHRYVTLEHLLLTLLDDPDAARLLQIAGADVAAIYGSVADAVNNRMASLAAPDGRQPSFNYRFDMLFQCANEDAMRLGRREIDGALALVAIAKDAESNASEILSANGFDPQAALKAMKTPPQTKRPPQPAPKPAKSSPAPEAARGFGGPSQKPANAGLSRPPIAAQAAILAAGGESMDEMIASVRTILEAEELKERALSQRTAVAAPRPEPPLKENGGAFNSGGRMQDPAGRLEPRIGPAPPARRPLHDASRDSGFSAARAPAFDLEKTPRTEKRTAPQRAPRRGNAGTVALLAKIIETIPRKARAGIPQTVQISLSKEEAGLIFGRVFRRPPQQAAGHEAFCRAVTIRLSAPEGGFFIEALTPETQWLLDRTTEEAFGTWAWTVSPKASGRCCLKASLCAREVDASGPGAVTALPDQIVKVRIRDSFWLTLASFVRAVLLMLAGSGLTMTAWYAWKVAVRLH